jgi:hypothetical protein
LGFADVKAQTLEPVLEVTCVFPQPLNSVLALEQNVNSSDASGDIGWSDSTAEKERATPLAQILAQLVTARYIAPDNTEGF